MEMNLFEANNTFLSGLTALFTCNLVVGLPADVCMSWLLAGGAGGAVASELFALNLSVCGISLCILSVYMMLHFLPRVQMDVGIQALQCILQLTFISRPVVHSCTCRERHLAVVHPTLLLRFKPLRYRLHHSCLPTVSHTLSVPAHLPAPPSSSEVVLQAVLVSLSVSEFISLCCSSTEHHTICDITNDVPERTV